MTLFAWVRAEQKSGLFKERGACVDSGSGYCITDADEVSLHSHLLKYQMVIIFSIKPVLSADQTIESIKRAGAAKKADKAAPHFFQRDLVYHED